MKAPAKIVAFDKGIESEKVWWKKMIKMGTIISPPPMPPTLAKADIIMIATIPNIDL